MKRILLSLVLCTLLSGLSAQFNTKAARLRAHLDILAGDSLLGRGFGTPQGEQAAAYIAQAFEAAGIEPLLAEYSHHFNYRQGILNIAGQNVVGLIRGSDPDLKDEYIVLGAHYDHLGWEIEEGDTVVYNGADDNASGSSALIEIARNLSQNREKLGRSVVLIAFDGEENGLIGSTFFIEDQVLELQKIQAMFSLDMVGMYEANEGLNLSGIKLLNDAEFLTGKLAERCNLVVRKANSAIEQRTDTAPFGEIGIAAIHANTGLKSPYHKPGDDAHLLDYEGMALICNYLSAVSMKLSNSEVVSELEAPDPEALQQKGPGVFRAGLRIRVGSAYHNYKKEFFQGKSIFATGAGLFTQIRLGRSFTLQPELLYETAGSRHQDGNFRSHALTAPLSLLLTTPTEGLVRAHLQLGGYYSHKFAGRIGDRSIDFKNTYTSEEYGLCLGFGMKVVNMHYDLIIKQGLNSLLRKENGAKISQRAIYFTMGYSF